MVDTEAADALLGRIVDDRYKIIEAMAAGAMGSVYKAERVPVGKLVAIKFLHKSYAKDGEFLTRFDRETKAMSQLAHPNCVSVVDFGVWENAPYLVMEYIAGTTLRTLLDRERVAPLRVLALARQITAGIAHAHAKGIVHRDVKPANIMITEEIGTGERVRVLDFGLARLRNSGDRDATQSNVVVGTPNYMAPEQTLPGMTVDARTDVYAIGVVLYEMLARERPFNAQDTMALLGMHRAAPIPRLADRVPDPAELPEGIQAVIDTAMAKSPDDRYQSAVELLAALDAVIDAGKPEPLRAPSSGSKPVAVPARSVGATTTAMAPTLIDQGRARLVSAVVDVPPPPGSWKRVAFGAMLLVGGIAGAAAWLVHKNNVEHEGIVDPVAATKDAAELGNAGSAGSAAVVAQTPADAAMIDAEAIDAAEQAQGSQGSQVGSDVVATDVGSGSAGSAMEVVGLGSSAVADAGTGSGSAAATTVAVGSDIELDGASAEDPNPHPNKTATEEAADAPATAAEAHKPAPPRDPLATTVTEAVAMIKDGKHDLALHSLLALFKKAPKSAYIPFLLGNLYYDQLWWGVAMDYYGEAIAHNGGYRSNAVLNHNVIRMLQSDKTQARAATFLRKTIGHPAKLFLQEAERSREENSIVRKQAAIVAKQIK
jgi:tRNA A-37 threonylcarbamoyl transferase component Bud32